MDSNHFNFTRAEIHALQPDPARRLAYFHDTKERGLVLCVINTGVKSFLVYRKVGGKPIRLTIGRFSHDFSESREIEKGVDPLSLLTQSAGLNVKMARAVARAVNSEFDRGNNPANLKRKVRGELTLGQMFDRYVDEYAVPQGIKTVPAMRANFERYLGEIKDKVRKARGREKAKPAGSVNWQNRKLTDISAADVRQLHAGLARSIGGHTANRTVEMLRALYARAEKWGEFEGANPAMTIEFADEPTRKRFIQASELGPFFEAVAAEPSDDMRDYVLLGLLTGARKANVMAMEWAHVQLDGKEWHIPETKNGEPVIVPLTPEVMTILKRRLAVRDKALAPMARGTTGETERAAERLEAVRRLRRWVFPSNSASGHMESPKKAWRRILDRTQARGFVDAVAAAHELPGKERAAALELADANPAKAIADFEERGVQVNIEPDQFALEDLRIHDLRRTLGSWQARTGASLVIIGKSLGHKSQHATAIYSRLDIDPVRESVERATAAMLKAGGIKAGATVTKLRKKAA